MASPRAPSIGHIQAWRKRRQANRCIRSHSGFWISAVQNGDDRPEGCVPSRSWIRSASPPRQAGRGDETNRQPDQKRRAIKCPPGFGDGVRVAPDPHRVPVSTPGTGRVGCGHEPATSCNRTGRSDDVSRAIGVPDAAGPALLDIVIAHRHCPSAPSRQTFDVAAPRSGQAEMPCRVRHGNAIGSVGISQVSRQAETKTAPSEPMRSTWVPDGHGPRDHLPKSLPVPTQAGWSVSSDPGVLGPVGKDAHPRRPWRRHARPGRDPVPAGSGRRHRDLPAPGTRQPVIRPKAQDTHSVCFNEVSSDLGPTGRASAWAKAAVHAGTF